MRTASKLIALVWVSLCAALFFGGCGGSDRAKNLPESVPTTGAGGDIDASLDGGESRGGAGGRGRAGKDAAADLDAAADADAPPANCGSLVCRGHGHCVVEKNVPECKCDTGYKLLYDSDAGVTGDNECIVDESCVRLKHLQADSCRYTNGGPPAVGTFFAVDYCAGTAVLPEKLGDLSTAFKILEDNVPVDPKLNPETYATVIPHGVESYVTFVLDVSTSLTDDHGLVSELVAELRGVIQQLRRPAGDPPVGISILVFGRTVQEYLPFTTNIDTVDAKLAQIEQDPGAVAALADGAGTSLNEAVERGIHSVERIQGLRDVVSQSGVLSTGTVVVVSDGNDTSKSPEPDDLIKNTLVNLISIGVSNQVDDTVLTAIGRDGSFLAPTATDRAQAFQEIAQRVKEYPQRSYLLGYCSTATTGNHSVTITLANGIKPQQDANCGFNATVFSGDARDVCNADTFAHGCDSRACGGLTGCGACPNSGDCCAGGQCQTPGPAPVDFNCRNQNELCGPGGGVCRNKTGSNPQVSECAPPVKVGALCDTDQKRCDPGVSYCNPTPASGAQATCLPTLALGTPCETGNQTHLAATCATQNCSEAKAGAIPFDCLPPARAFDRCSGATAAAVCETGSACIGEACKLRHFTGCAADNECASGQCYSGSCVEPSLCYFAWSDKMNSN